MVTGSPRRRRSVSPSDTVYSKVSVPLASANGGVKHGKAPAEPAAAATVPTCADFWPRFLTDYVLANRQKPSEVRSKTSIWNTHLSPAIGSTPLDAVATADVQRLKSALADRQPKTVNNVLTVLGTFLRQAVKLGVIAEMPCEVSGVKVPDSEIESLRAR